MSSDPRTLGRRALVAIAALALIVPAVAGTALAEHDIEPTPPPRGSVWTVFTTVQAVVDDNYAVVHVIADIGNRGPDPEFPFQVRVPENAFVSGLTIERDGQVFEAEIKERDVARQEYEEHKAHEQTGGLVEKTRGTQVYSFLVNVAEFESVRATLTYEVYLAANQGVYTLPLEAPVSGFGQDLGARFDATVRNSDGVTNVWGTPDGHTERLQEGWRVTHQVGPRHTDASTEWSAHYTLPATGNAGSLVVTVQDGTGYFAHRFRAPADAERIPLDMVMVLDTSGSMRDLKIEQLKDAASQVVGLLDEGDRLNLVLFSSSARTPWQGLRHVDDAVRDDALDEIDDVYAGGGTNIQDGIRLGFEAFDAETGSGERAPILVFLTDGRASTGVTDTAGLRDHAMEQNTAEATVFSIAFGSDADWGLVHALATDGNGVALRVPEGAGAEVDIQRFIAALTTPVLTDVRIEYDGDVDARMRTAPTLFAGSELLVVGTFDADMDTISGTVHATAPDGSRTYTFSEDVDGARGASFLPRLVAYHEIQALQDTIDAEGATDAWVDELTALALEHGFVTDHTSLVLTLPEGEPPVRPWNGRTTLDQEAADSGAAAPAMGGTATADRQADSAGAPPTSSESARTTDSTSRGGSADASDVDDLRDLIESQEGGGANTPGAGVVAVLAVLALGAVALGVFRGRRW